MLYSQVLETGGKAYHAGPHGETPGGQEEDERSQPKSLGQAFIEVSMGKARQGQGNSVRLASFKYLGGLWTIGMVLVV